MKLKNNFVQTSEHDYFILAYATQIDYFQGDLYNLDYEKLICLRNTWHIVSQSIFLTWLVETLKFVKH